MVTDAPLRRWERIALISALVIGLGAVAWLALPRSSAALGPLGWAELAPAPDVDRRAWRWIVIHHSGTPSGTAVGIDHQHRDARGWDGIGYHLVIGNGQGTREGRIEATFRWRGQQPGAHAGQRLYNELGIGLCVIGDYRTRPPSPLVERRLVELCALLIRHCPELSPASIIGHGEVPGKNTVCPGAGLDLPRLRRLVSEQLATKEP